MTEPLVLVTGASGFIAKHIIAELLRRGYPVRGTVRRLDKADDVRRAVTLAGADPSGLTFAVADLLSDAGWGDAAAGVTYVLHTASPFPLQQPDNPEDVIRPAVDGTRRVLKAAMTAGVKRVVVTSSTVAIFYGPDQPKSHVYSEADFTDETRAEMRKVLHDIQSGAFTSKWIGEVKSGMPMFKATRRMHDAHPIEEVGEKLRAMMPWIKANKLVDKAKN